MKCVHTRRLIAIAIICLCFSQWVFAQQGGSSSKRRERHIARIAGAVGGAVGGFMAGWAASDDDAINATRKLWRNIIIGSAAGGVGGYFVGRAIDKKLSVAFAIDPLQRGQIAARLLASHPPLAPMRSPAKLALF